MFSSYLRFSIGVVFRTIWSAIASTLSERTRTKIRVIEDISALPAAVHAASRAVACTNSDTLNPDTINPDTLSETSYAVDDGRDNENNGKNNFDIKDDRLQPMSCSSYDFSSADITATIDPKWLLASFGGEACPCISNALSVLFCPVLFYATFLLSTP